jgi:hypothetical protein
MEFFYPLKIQVTGFVPKLIEYTSKDFGSIS